MTARALNGLLSGEGMKTGIIVLAPYLTRAQAGAAQATLHIVNALGAHCREAVDVFTYDHEPDLLNPRVRVIRGRLTPLPRFFWRVPSAFALHHRQEELRAAGVPRAALCYTQNTNLGLAYRRMYPDVPIISHTGAVLADREYLEEQEWPFLQRAVESRLIRRLELASYRQHAWRHIASTRLVAKVRSAEFGLKENFFEVCPYGVDFRQFDRSRTHEDVRSRYGISPDAFLLVTVARLVKWKNIDMVIRAVAALPPAVELVIVGEGEERENLKAAALDYGVSDRVRFAGHQSPVPFLAAGNVFVLPSRIESFGMAYGEAMAMGLPCIGMRNDPPRVLSSAVDVIPEGIAGFCISDDDELAGRIRLLLKHPDLTRRLGEQAYTLAARTYTTSHYLDCMRRLVRSEGWEGTGLDRPSLDLETGDGFAGVTVRSVRPRLV